MPKRWRIRPHDPGQIARLEREAGVSAVVAQLLISRGICDPSAVRQFLDPKLNGLRDPEEYFQRLQRGVAAVRALAGEPAALSTRVVKHDELTSALPADTAMVSAAERTAAMWERFHGIRRRFIF